MIFRPVKALAAALVVVASLAFSTVASALVIQLNHEYTGGANPQGTLPWVTINIVQGGNDTTVDVTVTNNLLGSEFISELYLNFNPTKNAALINMNSVSGPPIPTFTRGDDFDKAGGDGYFDLLIDYAQSNSNGDRFGAGEISAFSLTFASGVTPGDFNFTSVDGPVGQTGFLAAAHIQSIAVSPGSGWIGNNGDPRQVPEPGSLALLGAALTALFVLGRCRKT